MVLESFLGLLISGGIYDLVKIGAVISTKELVLKLKEAFKKEPFSEEEYDKLTDIIKKVDKTYLLTQDIFIAYLKNSEELKEIVKNKKSGNNINQESYGAGTVNSIGDNNTITINNNLNNTEKK